MLISLWISQLDRNELSIIAPPRALKQSHSSVGIRLSSDLIAFLITLRAPFPINEFPLINPAITQALKVKYVCHCTLQGANPSREVMGSFPHYCHFPFFYTCQWSFAGTWTVRAVVAIPWKRYQTKSSRPPSYWYSNTEGPHSLSSLLALWGDPPLRVHTANQGT